jgi:hypothetical protein
MSCAVSKGNSTPQTLFWQTIGTWVHSGGGSNPAGAPGGVQQLAALVHEMGCEKIAGGVFQLGSRVDSVYVRGGSWKFSTGF